MYQAPNLSYTVALEDRADLPEGLRIDAEVQFARELEAVLGGPSFVAETYEAWLYVTESEARRHKSGLIGAISMSSLESDVAGVVRKNGGDAVILTQSDAETIGAVGVANASQGFGWGVARGVQKQNSKFVVVKYMADAPAPAVAPVTLPVQQSMSASQPPAAQLPATQATQAQSPQSPESASGVQPAGATAK